MTRPVVSPKESAVSARYGNGQIPTDEMILVLPELGRFGWLLPAPARGWRAMTAAASDAGYRLDATGMYRSLADQEALFRQRFTPHLLPPGKWWQARWWRLKPGMATAARPGTSNHGKGRSIDAAEELDGDPAPEGLSSGLLRWLEVNAVSFGFSWEKGIDRSEPWHLVYFLGDDVTPRTLAYEASLQPPPPTLTEDDMPQPIPTGPAGPNGRVPFLQLVTDTGKVSVVGHNGAKVIAPLGADQADSFGRQVTTFPVAGAVLGWSLHGGRVVIATDQSATYTVEIAA